jgi:hypothetical protein
MKCLIYKLFSGVGFCNQVFSLETGIYLANISKRKLILLIPQPMCHCGRASWDYGYFLNYFTKDFLKYLPYGFEVHYKTPPEYIKSSIADSTICKEITYACSFSNLVFIDKELDTEENNRDIIDFLHCRQKSFLMFDENENYDYFYVSQSSASRCFYNFYTTPDNYMLMINICESLKIHPFIQECANNIYAALPNNKNTFNLFCHLRFGDKHKDAAFINRSNNIILKNINEYINGHITNLIKPTVYCMIDNHSNTQVIENMKKYTVVYIDDQLTNSYIETKLKDNNMINHNFNKCTNYAVATALIEMLLCVKGNEFVGTTTSTVSHYIQYLRYKENKAYFNYCNFRNKNVRYCRLQPMNDCKYPWIKYKYMGGHPVSWHVFWSPNTLLGQSENITKKIFITD